MQDLNPNSFAEMIRSGYSIYEQLGISVTSLIVLSVIFSLAFLFAVREAATWFFKIDDIKRDVVRLREVVAQMENEIRLLHNQLEPMLPRKKTDQANPLAPKPPVTHSNSAANLGAIAQQKARLNNIESGFKVVH